MEKKFMGQVLHANARTTEAIRREIRNSEESIAKAAIRFNVNPKTIIKWKKREDTKDLPMGLTSTHEPWVLISGRIKISERKYLRSTIRILVTIAYWSHLIPNGS